MFLSSSLFLLSSSSLLLSLSKTTLSLSLTRSSCCSHCHLFTTMSISLQSHAFAGNPIRSKTTPKSTDPFSPTSALETLKTLLLDNTHNPSSSDFKVLPFRKGRPLASSSAESTANPVWHLGWMSLGDCKGFLENSEVSLSENSLVYLGSKSEEDVVYWAIDVSGDGGLVSEFGKRQLCFVELRTLMVTTDWADADAMGQLAIAGHAMYHIYWHQFTGVIEEVRSQNVWNLSWRKNMHGCKK